MKYISGDLIPLTAGGMQGGMQPCGDWFPITYPNTYPTWPSTTATYVTVPPPTHCSGENHVFPCPHCNKCKCGKATIER
jgi:hypothetical protein